MEDENVAGKLTNVEAIVEKKKLDDAATTKSEELTTSIVASREIEKKRIKLDNNVEKCGSKKVPGSTSAKIGAKLGKKASKILKREILAGNRENRGVQSRSLQREKRRGVGIVGVGGKKTKRGTSEAKRGKITEYAQYLGLQPASSNKVDCTNCRETKNSHCSTSMLDQHQCTCISETMTQSTSSNVSPISTETNSVSPLTSANTGSTNNFRITRKVYLCAACGTYFENWNLFLHMREIHKRHICLFCLGMFGQAERLSYHLTKKHSVPETTFTSVEDFYNVFKGSCYLICCTCEKVFAETDNFYNHFCSPVVKGRGAASQTTEICSFCRKSVNKHASTCLHGQTDNSEPTIAGLPGIPGIPGKIGDAKRVPRNKRITKNNRFKRNDESSLTTEISYARKLSVKTREQLDEKPVENVEKETIVESFETATTTMTTTTAPTTISTAPTTSTNLPITISTKIPPESDAPSIHRDTVSETIMEVSKYTDDPRFHDGFHEPSVDFVERTIKITSSPSPSLSSSSLASPIRPLGESCYDSVTETIMEVSRCYDNEIDSSVDDNQDDDEENGNDDKSTRNETSSRGSDVLIMDEPGLTENDEETTNRRINYDRLKNSLSIVAKNDRRRKKRRRTRRKDEETIELSESNDGRSSTDTDNDAAIKDESRTSRSWQKTISHRRSSSSSPAKESHARSSVSFTTVNSTDRSLVIKICTNRNSQFSIARSVNGASNAICNNDNHDTSRESEENNNAEDSGSEDKTSIHSDHESSDENEDEDEEVHSDADREKSDAKTMESETTNLNVEVTDENATREENCAKDDDDSRNEVTAEEKVVNENKNDESSCPLNVETLIDAEKSMSEENDGIILASEDVPSIDLNVDGLLETMKIDDLLKRCINAASSFCVYCNHARCIAVNGKQLGLHVLAEHRFQPQHPAIIIQREQFIEILKKSLVDVETSFFNLDSYDNARGTYEVPVPRVFECFHCRYHSLVHKEIYLHNRKMHQKVIIICIMCKSTFYSYSELLCHLCPGVYSPNTNVTYRCCLCPVDNLPSAFRLMVHLRKRHHSCDVCLESTGNQQRLSNHVWKHKLHHLCYRCGIAYRNKPDITKHLFWKHGTESVLCKKCLQKKWPHVYHFCIPPTAFVCEECTSSFTRAVALKVHKRLHTGDRPYGCSECEERFISKKVMMKHELGHREPAFVEPEVAKETPMDSSTREEDIIGQEKIDVMTTVETTATTMTTTTMTTSDAETTNAGDNYEKSIESTIENKEAKEPVKKVVDVYDLPPLNLSSDSDTDNEEIPPPTAETTSKDPPTEVKSTPEESPKIDDKDEASEDKVTKPETSNVIVDDVELNEDVKKEEAQIMDGIWDNFKSYAASLENPSIEMTIAEARRNEEEARIREEEAIEKKRRDDEMREFLCKVIIADHDYCVVYTDKTVEEEETKEETKEETPKVEDNCGTMEGEHDYGHKVAESPSNGSIVINCDSDNATTTPKRKKEKTPKKKKSNGATSSSDSSSDSDSSSCSCGTNCSCSSSSSGSSSSSSSSSDSDSSASESSPRKQTVRKERRREKEKENTTIEAARNSVEKPEVEEKIEVTSIAEENEQIVAEEETKDLNPTVEINVEQRPASPQLIFPESDLDTDETETDEDFYDEHPQQLANKLLAEKRNQLMLLAAVAPVTTETSVPSSNNLNNGNFTNDAINEKPADIALTINEEVNKFDNTSNLGTTRKRVKTKKRKKSDRGKAPRISTPTVESIKLNIPKSFYQKNKKNSSTLITVMPSRSSTPSIVNSTPNESTTKYPNDTSKSVRIGESGSENENKRSSKRKRVPKRFYGDSSDEESQQQQFQQQTPEFHYNQPNLKWRKVETPPVVPSISIKAPIPPTIAPNPSYATKSVTLKLSGFDRPLERIVPIVTAPSESEEQAESSSADSSENEELPAPVVQLQPPPISRPPIQHHPAMIGNPTISGIGPERSPNLYCYCQCPYDEVSEMIACDGSDCQIEWFHFECVGIMVPPKGKWYCPDCRKKDPSLVNDEYLE